MGHHVAGDRGPPLKCLLARGLWCPSGWEATRLPSGSSNVGWEVTGWGLGDGQKPMAILEAEMHQAGAGLRMASRSLAVSERGLEEG